MKEKEGKREQEMEKRRRLSEVRSPQSWVRERPRSLREEVTRPVLRVPIRVTSRGEEQKGLGLGTGKGRVGRKEWGRTEGTVFIGTEPKGTVGGARCVRGTAEVGWRGSEPATIPKTTLRGRGWSSV